MAKKLTHRGPRPVTGKLATGWRYTLNRKAITTVIRCKDFMSAVKLINKIAKLAEKMDHHPDLHLTRYRRLKIVLTTHEAGGVTERDFVMAKIISERVR